MLVPAVSPSAPPSTTRTWPSWRIVRLRSTTASGIRVSSVVVSEQVEPIVVSAVGAHCVVSGKSTSEVVAVTPAVHDWSGGSRPGPPPHPRSPTAIPAPVRP